MFTIAESLILLGTDDEKGTMIHRAASKLDYGLVGAILAELIIEEKVSLKDDKVAIIDDSLTDIPYFDSVISEIKESKRQKKVSE